MIESANATIAELNSRDAKSYTRLFGEQHDWPATPVKRRYIILSTPRTGSTMLCSSLAVSGLAGHAVEYLSPKNLELYRRIKGPVSFSAIWHDYQSRRTSPNGYFGTKMHCSQFQALFGKNLDAAGANFLRSFDRHILCFRRDKIDQAISKLLAAEPGGEWNDEPSGGPLRRDPKPDDIAKISKHITTLTREETHWRQVTTALKLKVHQVAYEDLASDTLAVLADVFDFLDIGLNRNAVPMPRTRKLPNNANRELKLAYLGATKGV